MCIINTTANNNSLSCKLINYNYDDDDEYTTQTGSITIYSLIG